MPSLYELTQDALALQDMFENGDIDEQTLSDTLEAMGIEEKAENICKVIRNLDAKAKAYKEEKDRMAKRQKECENGVNRLKESLLLHLNTLKKPKLEAGLFTVSKSMSKKVEITAEHWLDEKYLDPQPPKVNKTRITEDLKNGIEVAGAKFVENEYLTIK